FEFIGDNYYDWPFMVTAHKEADYRTERANGMATVNFMIPADQFYGVMKLTVQINGHGNPQRSLIVRADLVQTLRVRAILIDYDGPSTAVVPAGAPQPANLTLPAPTMADVESTASMALAAMPVRATGSFVRAATLSWNLPLDGPADTEKNWNLLLTALDEIRLLDGNRSDVIYYGFLPQLTPAGGTADHKGVLGKGVPGLGSGRVLEERTFIHEAGHACDLAHAPCGDPKDPDKAYPTYGMSSASIGEFGLDIRYGQVKDPQTTRDYMSYCGPSWISLYHHAKLIEHSRLTPPPDTGVPTRHRTDPPGLGREVGLVAGTSVGATRVSSAADPGRRCAR
ncbi:M66 family metalloprotease, partial [Gordonia aquimaris]